MPSDSIDPEPIVSTLLPLTSLASLAFLTPKHVQHLNACYPPSSALLAAAPDYAPNSHELSRLTYYASNNRGKLTKIAVELEKRLRTECRKACNGNLRMRASLLITLSIFRSLASECKRDIALISPSLIASVEVTITSLSSDLEIVARAASVFTAWTTYTDGHLIGADSTLTSNYLSALSTFASLSRIDASDLETRNRTRLVGLAALTAALNSEALYNDFVQYRAQVAVILYPILLILLQPGVSTLNEQAAEVKDSGPLSPYLAEFRQRPTYERRAASIHIHVDGDKGPPNNDVCDAALRALFSLLDHANSPQLGFIMQSTFDNLDKIQGWGKSDHCCWLGQRIADWAQYQYRYVVPTWLVERLLENQGSTTVTPMHQALAAMITTLLNSPTRMINLSSSGILSNLMTIVIRRTIIDAEDPLIQPLERCVASLGTHVYYSDQIQDLVGELVGRLITIEIQGVMSQGKPGFTRSRSAAIRAILAGLKGLIKSANKSDSNVQNGVNKVPSRSHSPMADRSSRDLVHDSRISRRTRVPPDIWQDTLSLICDRDSSIRRDYTNALIYYLTSEIPRYGDYPDPDGIKRTRKLAEGPFAQATNTTTLLHPGDAINKFLNALHVYVYLLLTSSALGLTSSSSPGTSSPANIDVTASQSPVLESPSDTYDHDRRESISQATGRRSLSLLQGPRDRKLSLIFKYVKRAQTCLSTPPAASLLDIQDALKVLRTAQEQIPIRSLLAGVPMVLALQRAVKTSDENPSLLRRIFAIDELVARVWLTIGTVWNAREVVKIANKALGSMRVSFLSPRTSLSEDTFLTLQDFSWNQGTPWATIDGGAALEAIVTNETVLDAFGVDKETLLRRLSMSWTPEAVLNDLERPSGFEATLRGDGVSPLLRISPALMHMNNVSLQSLARSTRGLGVTDLREALEGRSSMSNPALVRPPSISTLDHASVASGENKIRLTPTRSRGRHKKRMASSAAAGEVRDVLSRLGIGRQNTNLLKASFSAMQKSDQR